MTEINETFEKQLMQFFDGAAKGAAGLRKQKEDYERLIAYGAVGEWGDNYYLFIYRDSFERTVRYGAVLFLYQPLDLDEPVRVTCTDGGNDWRRRDIYIETAVYFLKHRRDATIALSGVAKELYDEVMRTVAGHTQARQEQDVALEHVDFNVLDQDIRFTLARPREARQGGGSPSVMEKLKLFRPPDSGDGLPAPKRSRGRAGLCLEVEGQGLKAVRFKPVIVPVKLDGTDGAVKPVSASILEKYQLDDVPAVLGEFIDHFLGVTRRGYQDPARTETIAHIYWERLAALLTDMPDALTFCRFAQGTAPLYPLKKIKFKQLEIKFAPSPDRERLSFFLVLTGMDGDTLDAGSDFQVFFSGGTRMCLIFSLSGDRYYFALPADPAPYERLFRFMCHVRQFSVDDLEPLLTALQQVAGDALVIDPEPLPLYILNFRPVPVLKILERDRMLKLPERIEVEFDYQPGIDRFMTENRGARLVVCEKDGEFETLCLNLLKNDALLNLVVQRDRRGDRVQGYYFTFTGGNDLEWLMESSPGYLEKGFKIYSSRRGRYIGRTGSTLRIAISSGIRWLEFKPLLEDGKGGPELGVTEIDIRNGTVTDQRGTLHMLKPEDIQTLIRLMGCAERHGEVFRVPAENHFLINMLYEQRMGAMPGLEEKLDTARQLKDFKKISPYKVSRGFNGTLRKYQLAGFRWLRFLWEYGVAGCLADDMGLGKTVQTLALLQTLKDDGNLGTSLLVLPVSAIPNWESEMGKFTPGLTFYRHLGGDRTRDMADWTRYDLVVTSYATLRNDIGIFRDFEFDYIVLDEAQAIKNLTSQVSRAVKILKSSHRLALTGTPIENTSMELWSLFDYLMPGFLGTPHWFRSQWAQPVERDQDEGRAGLLRQMVYPFVLRRKKEDVDIDLPAKTELTESLVMEEEQRELYIETADYYSRVIAETIDSEGLEKSSFKILEGMLRLRQICLFPQLADAENKDVPSVKFEHFTGMLRDILAENHKVLIFSQFVKVLSILRKYMDNRGIRYSYIDGSVDAEERGRMITRFQEDEGIRVFLLSLKAGGVAINLTAADYVIIFDPWWNPAVEAQAIDRSHRMGQTRKVFVYRLVVKGTIEEKMLELQNLKRGLVDRLIATESGAFKSLNRDDVMKLFRFS